MRATQQRNTTLPPSSPSPTPLYCLHPDLTGGRPLLFCRPETSGPYYVAWAKGSRQPSPLHPTHGYEQDALGISLFSGPSPDNGSINTYLSVTNVPGGKHILRRLLASLLPIGDSEPPLMPPDNPQDWLRLPSCYSEAFTALLSEKTVALSAEKKEALEAYAAQHTEFASWLQDNIHDAGTTYTITCYGPEGTLNVEQTTALQSKAIQPFDIPIADWPLDLTLLDALLTPYHTPGNTEGEVRTYSLSLSQKDMPVPSRWAQVKQWLAWDSQPHHPLTIINCGQCWLIASAPPDQLQALWPWRDVTETHGEQLAALCFPPYAAALTCEPLVDVTPHDDSMYYEHGRTPPVPLARYALSVCHMATLSSDTAFPTLNMPTREKAIADYHTHLQQQLACITPFLPEPSATQPTPSMEATREAADSAADISAPTTPPTQPTADIIPLSSPSETSSAPVSSHSTYRPRSPDASMPEMIAASAILIGIGFVGWKLAGKVQEAAKAAWTTLFGSQAAEEETLPQLRHPPPAPDRQRAAS